MNRKEIDVKFKMKHSYLSVGDLDIQTYHAAYLARSAVVSILISLELDIMSKRLHALLDGHAEKSCGDESRNEVHVWLGENHPENKWTKTNISRRRRPGQILERHNLAEDCTIQTNLEAACWGLRPNTGHYGCPMMMMMEYHRITRRENKPADEQWHATRSARF